MFGPASAYTWEATEVTNGSHMLRLAAQTASGRETWAVEQRIMVDNRPPVPAAPAGKPDKKKAVRKPAS